MIRQLFISSSYPPIDSSVTLINSKINNKLEIKNILTTVLTVTPEDTILPVNNELETIFASKHNVYRVHTWEKGSATVTLLRRILRKLMPFLFFVPDYHFIWTILASKELYRIRKESPFDIIHSVSAPYCSHIVGLFAKLTTGKPWVCHMDDFWADNPAEHFSCFRFANYWLERLCFEFADAIISSSREILDLASRRCSSRITKKFIFIPPGYEPSHYPTIENHEKQKYILSYLGAFYKNKREPYTLLEALKMLKDSNTKIYTLLEVRLIGDSSSDYQEMINQLSINDAAKCFNRVNYLKSMELMKDSSVLIHLGYMSGKHVQDIHISGKLFEYLGAERLILGVTTLDGPVADFIRNANGKVCDYNSPESIAQTITDIVQNYTIKELYNWNMNQITKATYHIDRIADSYSKLFSILSSESI